ncbi:MAG: MATE family efflux transporter [Alphaproteobacteria bacterium]|nr:MATE family efflux transporter [Alphaproteobacteria bacterium]
MTAATATMDPRTRRLLEAPIVPLLLRMAWPNVLIMIAQASTGLIETWWLAKLGTDALAGMALVFPPFMLMTMISAGAMGGGISSAVARALGAGKRDAADAIVLHAVVVNLALALVFAIVFLAFGRDIYRAMGGTGGELEAALVYSDIVFAGGVFVWVSNALASVIRGTGNMLFPAIVTSIGVAFLIPASPLLIFGVGPIPALGVAGGGLAVVIFFAGATLAFAWYILTGRNAARLRWVKLRWTPIADILRIGAFSAISSILTTLVIAGATALVAHEAGADAVAGFGTGARLEYLLIPLIFGIGAPMVALVGTNIGAGNRDRALSIAMVGGALAFAVTEAIGIVAAIWPETWLGLFSVAPAMIETGSAYLRIVGPFYGFFGLGLALYFASQGAGRLFWPLLGGLLRVAIALGGSVIALRLGAPIDWIFVCLAAALAAYGIVVAVAVRGGAWFR